MPPLSRKVYQYTLDGKFVAEYENILAASHLNNLDSESIRRCCCNKGNHASHYYWTYTYYMKLPNTIIDIINSSRKTVNYRFKNDTIYQYDLDGNLVNQYKNYDELPFTEDKKYQITKNLNGRYKTVDDFIFKNNYYTKLPEEILNEHLPLNRKKIYQYDSDGNFIQMWNTISDANKNLNSQLSNAINAIIKKTCNGFIFRSDYYEKLPLEILEQHTNVKFSKILQYDLDGKFIKEWNSIRDAKKALEITGKKITNCVNGRQKQAGGFIWKYKE
jgi:hypothetical protein